MFYFLTLFFSLCFSFEHYWSGFKFTYSFPCHCNLLISLLKEFCISVSYFHVWLVVGFLKKFLSHCCITLSFMHVVHSQFLHLVLSKKKRNGDKFFLSSFFVCPWHFWFWRLLWGYSWWPRTQKFDQMDSTPSKYLSFLEVQFLLPKNEVKNNLPQRAAVRSQWDNI